MKRTITRISESIYRQVYIVTPAAEIPTFYFLPISQIDSLKLPYITYPFSLPASIDSIEINVMNVEYFNCKRYYTILSNSLWSKDRRHSFRQPKEVEEVELRKLIEHDAKVMHSKYSLQVLVASSRYYREK